MKRFVLIGHPVGHSMSPVMHRAAYAAMGHQASYDAVDCPDEGAVAAKIADLRRGLIHGANVTVPWKRVALSLADDVDVSAAETGAANVLVPVRSCESTRVVAYNTDAGALVHELNALVGLNRARTEKSSSPARVALILGAGGAALAATVACRQLHFTEITVTARRWTGTLRPSDWPEAQGFRRLGATPVAWQEVAAICASERWQKANQRLVIQATTAGMKGTAGGEEIAAKIPWIQLRQSAFAYDVVYTPECTPFLQAAAAAGVMHAGGLGMLVAQAEAAVRLWLGEVPPAAVMLKAARETLERRP